jgi:dephospho-CoA kinase
VGKENIAMKIICISGSMGSGKTTSAKLFVKILHGSVAIHGDDFMWGWEKQNQKEFNEIFEIPQGIESSVEYLRNNMTAEQLRKFVSACTPFVEKEIEKAICNQENLSLQFIIIEWAGLPGFKVWNRADYRVIVNSPHILLIERLKKRMEKKGYSEAAIKRRTNSIKDIPQTMIRIDYIINNNSNEECHLYEEVRRICDELQGKVYL